MMYTKYKLKQMIKIEKNNIEEEIKDKIINWITIGESGRLIVSKPEKNNLGEDLIIEKRGDYKGEDILFKICSLVGPIDKKDFEKDFFQEEFKADKNLYLLFVYFDSIKQKINDYVWLIPSLQFQDLAEISEISGKKVLRFKSSLDITKKDKYSKFLVYTKDLGKLVFEAFESKGKFNFKETVFKNTKKINIETLKEFLLEARLNTYASNNKSVDNPRLLESVQFEFQKNNLFYRDIYFLGNKKFIGQEIIYQDSKPIWGMNYIGDAMGKLENIFLKDLLLKLVNKCRLGQNCEFEKGNLKYEDNGQGVLEDFYGQEKIFSFGKNIYKLDYRGGLISDNL